MDAIRLSTRLKSANKVCVLGAGTMGSGIAAHLANLGFEVTLLDLTIESVTNSFDRARSARPPHFFVKQTADKIRLGSIQENISWVSDADWVCEAIIEKLDAKRDLYAQVEPLLSPDALISTNTSGLEIGLLIEGRSESFKKRFVGTHFFNPPRYLKLLELIATDQTDREILPAVTEFLEHRVARRVVQAKDTPGFIANRYGMWSMYQAVHVAERLGMKIETVDVITGPFLGRPRSGSFRLNDIVGIDIMEDIAQNQIRRCLDDPYIGTLIAPKSIEHLKATGNIGDKAGKGYYDRVGRDFFSMDLKSFEYRPKEEIELPIVAENARKPMGERIRNVLHSGTQAAEFLTQYLIPTLRYADYLKNEVAYTVEDFDRVMKWGFGWEMGPFEMIDAIGHDLVLPQAKNFYVDGNQLRTDEQGYEPRVSQPEYRALTDYPVIDRRENISIRDLEEGIFGIEFNTKMGSVSPGVVADLHQLLDERPNDRYVLSNPGRAFSVGFDLKFFLAAIDNEDWHGIDAALIQLQTLGEKLSRTKVVAAIHGYSLGGGLELAMSCPIVVSSLDATVGLPESKVGLIPGGRGVTMMRLRGQETTPLLREVIGQTVEGFTATNAFEALHRGFLRDSDILCHHPDRLITTAKEAAKAVKPTPLPAWKPISGPLMAMVNDDVSAKLKSGVLSPYDEVIGEHLKLMMMKSESYEESVAQERERFLILCKRPETRARIAHMLETGKPLRN